MSRKSNKKKHKMIKIVYFDEDSASDYNIIKSGGQIDWTTEENKDKLAKIVGRIESEAKSGFNLFSYLKASISGSAGANVDYETSKIINSTVSNTILTDYLTNADKDKNVVKFYDCTVKAPKDSVTLYRMYSSYLNIVPQEQLPMINIEGLNNAILGERGYYQMLLQDENKKESILRFNIKAFKNNYTLVDLSKMDLSYYAIKVGKTTKEQLALEKEFDEFEEDSLTDINEIVSGEKMVSEDDDFLDMYDVVLAGVSINE
ncbi:hypothetical protein HMPREF9176_1735 [Streptococcus downei F0415]|uniref:DUF6414 family protein n=1 Tax=Streptococcus downei TaxID=1317 RepID=UPI0001E994D8|nr:DUF6414 family protein [Streptococcus downei]EFQ57662.1 hypothetical protein HMPREF9176_1735 [Streptococcus downei F0415]